SPRQTREGQLFTLKNHALPPDPDHPASIDRHDDGRGTHRDVEHTGILVLDLTHIPNRDDRHSLECLPKRSWLRLPRHHYDFPAVANARRDHIGRQIRPCVVVYSNSDYILIHGKYLIPLPQKHSISVHSHVFFPSLMPHGFSVTGIDFYTTCSSRIAINVKIPRVSNAR